MTRRESLKALSAGGMSLALFQTVGCAHTPFPKAAETDTSFPLARYSPIRRDMPEPSEHVYTGDVEPKLRHRILWDKKSYLAENGLPQPGEHAKVVIVGGGMSGLFTAYLLRDLNPILLEQADRFGGNAKGESWRGIDYSIGAAYFMGHEPGSGIDKLFSELGIYGLCRKKSGEDPVHYAGRFIGEFWNGETDPKHKKQFARLRDHFKSMNDGKIAYPDLPTERAPAAGRPIDEYDRYDFLSYCEKVNGGPLHPHIAALLEHYCWSTIGCGMKDVSAAIGLNQYVSEFGDSFVAPGGNSLVGETVLRRLSQTMNPENLRPSSFTVDVRFAADGDVLVTYLTAEEKPVTIKTKTCVFACPKFIVGRIWADIEPERLAALSKLRYHPYMVANVMLNKPLDREFYDLYLIKAGKVNFDDVPASAEAQKTTDLILGTFAKNRTDATVLTLYRAFPWAGARGELLQPASYTKYRTQFEDEIKTQILPMLGSHEKHMAELRIARWGHPMPVAGPGLIRSGALETLHAPARDRVFFVHQDNWAVAAIETCAGEAIRWSPAVRKSALA